MNALVSALRTAAPAASPAGREPARHDAGASFGQAFAAERHGAAGQRTADQPIPGKAVGDPSRQGRDVDAEPMEAAVLELSPRIVLPERWAGDASTTVAPGTDTGDTAVDDDTVTASTPEPDAADVLAPGEEPTDDASGTGTTDEKATASAPVVGAEPAGAEPLGEEPAVQLVPATSAAGAVATTSAAPANRGSTAGGASFQPAPVTSDEVEAAGAAAKGADRPVSATPGADAETSPPMVPVPGRDGAPAAVTVTTTTTTTPAADALTPSAAPMVSGPATPSVPAAAPAAHPPVPAGAAPPPEPLNRQLAGPIATLATGPQGGRTMTVNVAPEGLGPVTVKAHLGLEGLRVELMAPTDVGRDALRIMLGDLRRDLAGLGHGSLSVSTGDQPDGGAGDEPEQQDPARGEARPRDGAGDQGGTRAAMNRSRGNQPRHDVPDVVPLDDQIDPTIPPRHFVRLDVLA